MGRRSILYFHTSACCYISNAVLYLECGKLLESRACNLSVNEHIH